jgi:hypothetical protein
MPIGPAPVAAEPPAPGAQASPPPPVAAAAPRAPDAASGRAPEVEARIRSAVEAAVRPLQQSVLDLQNQLAEAQRIIRERELGGAPLDPNAPAPVPARARMVSRVEFEPPRPVLDLKAIERDKSIVIDDMFDGRKRRRKAVIVFSFFLLVIFGGLFALLWRSYQPHA